MKGFDSRRWRRRCVRAAISQNPYSALSEEFRWHGYCAAIMTLEFCSRFDAVGRRVKLVKRGHRKHADATVAAVVDREVVVEFKALPLSDAQQRWDAFDTLWLRAFMRAQVPVDCLETGFVEPALEQVDAVIAAMLSVARARTTDLVELPMGAGSPGSGSYFSAASLFCTAPRSIGPSPASAF